MKRRRHRWRWIVALILAHIAGYLSVALILAAHDHEARGLDWPSLDQLLLGAVYVPWALIPWVAWAPDRVGVKAATSLVYLAPFAVLVVIWARRRHVIPDDTLCCRVCGYDCRHTPTRCPECGTVA